MPSKMMTDATAAFEAAGPLQLVDAKIAGRVDEILKRVIDIVVASTAILLLSPLILCVAMLIKATGSSALYAHRRVGRRGRPFPCYKFRTMRPDANEVLASYLAANPEAAREWQTNRKLRFDPRVTPLGRLFRESSLDELPQLFNILNGTMSFVGPRPVVFDELQRYGLTARDYFSVRPGLTGLWQVSGRNLLDFAQRVEIDRHYLRNRSLLIDLSIMARTIPEVVWRRQTS